MTGWEYRVQILEMYPSINCSRDLNRWGAEGWELVAVVSSPDENGRVWQQAILKRPDTPSPSN